jgi:hypothetical protein
MKAWKVHAFPLSKLNMRIYIIHLYAYLSLKSLDPANIFLRKYGLILFDRWMKWMSKDIILSIFLGSVQYCSLNVFFYRQTVMIIPNEPLRFGFF